MLVYQLPVPDQSLHCLLGGSRVMTSLFKAGEERAEWWV